MTPEAKAALRERMLAALAVSAAERGGAEKADRAGVAKMRQAEGLGRSSAFAWVAQAIASGEVEAELVNRARGAGGTPGPLPQYQAAVPAMMPMPHADGGDFIAAVQLLNSAVQDALRARALAFHADGRVRNTKLLLTAAEALRKVAETAVRVQQAQAELDELARFHRKLISAVLAEAGPDVGPRILRRLDQLAAAELGAAA